METQPKGGAFETLVTLDVAADRDYEIFTALEYRTEADGKPAPTVPLHLVKRGAQTVSFVSDRPPRAIQLDPAWQVPQSSLAKAAWTAAD